MSAKKPAMYKNAAKNSKKQEGFAHLLQLSKQFAKHDASDSDLALFVQ
jgi:hypothetical protein